MDAILATDWLHNAYPEQKNTTGDPSEKDNKEDQISWLKIIDEEEEKSGKPCEMEGTAKNVKNEQQQQQNCNEKIVPLLDYLCQHYKCTTKELHVLVQQLDVRRSISELLRCHACLRTNHLRPIWKNFNVHCNELSIHPSHTAYALRGYLGISVRAYFYVKHGVKLRFPQLPCVVQYGGGEHCSLFPFECLEVINQN